MKWIIGTISASASVPVICRGEGREQVGVESPRLVDGAPQAVRLEADVGVGEEQVLAPRGLAGPEAGVLLADPALRQRFGRREAEAVVLGPEALEDLRGAVVALVVVDDDLDVRLVAREQRPDDALDVVALVARRDADAHERAVPVGPGGGGGVRVGAPVHAQVDDGHQQRAGREDGAGDHEGLECDHARASGAPRRLASIEPDRPVRRSSAS